METKDSLVGWISRQCVKDWKVGEEKGVKIV